jgi:hypothetical protein
LLRRRYIFPPASEHRQIIAPHAKPRRHGVDAVITARKEHVAGCDRSGDQGGKAARTGDSTENENRTQSVGTRSPPERDVPDMRVCDQGPHDKRSHKSQQKMRPFTADELDQRSLVRA